jgi:hypothetical protein
VKAGDLVKVSECRALNGIAIILCQRGFDFFDILIDGQKILMSRDFMRVINESR